MSNFSSTKLPDPDRCRVCLDKAEKLYPLQGPIANCDVDVYTMITYCTSLEIELNDDLPNGVCVPCFRTVRIAYNFILQFRENERKLIAERAGPEEITKENYVYIDDDDFETKEDINSGKAEGIELLNEYEIVEADEENETYFRNDTEHFDKLEGEAIKYDDTEQETIEEQPGYEECDQQEVEIENLNIFVENLVTMPNSTANLQNVAMKIIKKPPASAIQQPQTVLRRKIKIRFACPVCPKVYFANFESGFVPHMSLHSGHFTCNVCTESETLYNADAFLNHFMQHHRYQCPFCGKSFNKTGTLTAHIKTHYKFRYHCSNESCSKSFPTQWSLKKHEAVHSNSCEYTCIECNMEFKTYDTYMYHQKKHSGRRFLCMCCGRTFMQSVHLKYHMQQHTGIKHFKCNWCVKSYTSSSQLKKHKRRHHPDQVENAERPYVLNIGL